MCISWRGPVVPAAGSPVIDRGACSQLQTRRGSPPPPLHPSRIPHGSAGHLQRQGRAQGGPPQVPRGAPHPQSRGCGQGCHSRRQAAANCCEEQSEARGASGCGRGCSIRGHSRRGCRAAGGLPRHHGAARDSGRTGRGRSNGDPPPERTRPELQRLRPGARQSSRWQPKSFAATLGGHPPLKTSGD